MIIGGNQQTTRTDKSFLQYLTRGDVNEGRDNFKTGTKKDNFLQQLARMKDMRGNSTGSVSRTLYIPDSPSTSHVKPRNENPVVIVHGTMSEEGSIQKYKDAALETGHPTELTTYMTIKDGHRLEESGQVVSKNINNSRVEVTKGNLKELEKIKNDPGALKEYFHISSSLYGSKDENAGKLTSLLPGTIDKMGNLLKMDKNELLESFSGRTKEIEKGLAKDVEGIGYDEKTSGKIASEIMDNISPKAVLIGHSMGGFVSYSLMLNPKDKIDDKNQFSYDGANGVATVITLSSPVGKGLNKLLPKGLANLTYDLMQKNILDPMEAFPGMQFCMVNPFFSAWYETNKAMTKELCKDTSLVTTMMTNPMTYLQKPGFKQIVEGSDFIKEYVENKKVPDGITMIAAFNKEDGVSEGERSKVNESQPNAHNLDADVKVTPEDLKDPRTTKSTMTHIKMSKYPFEHGEEFKKEILENPSYMVRLLDSSNYEGIRWRCLDVLNENLAKDPSLLSKPEYKAVLQKLHEVAEEKLPFANSASAAAEKILSKLN